MYVVETCSFLSADVRAYQDGIVDRSKHLKILANELMSFSKREENNYEVWEEKQSTLNKKSGT